MSPTLKVALIQLQPKSLALEVNFARAVTEIREAASQGADIAVLPEYYLTSWVPEHPDFAVYCAKSVDYLSRYQELAKELNIHIVPGTIVAPVQPTVSKDTNSKDVELHNYAHFISASTGEVLSSYQKKNLWHSERNVLTAGKHTPHMAFDVLLRNGGTIRVGMLICWDLAFPEPFRELLLDGVQLIIIPSYWSFHDIDPRLLALNRNSEAVFLANTTVARAYENNCAVAFCNAFGESQVTMPILGSLGKVAADVEETIISEIDLDVLKLAEEAYKVRADLQGEEWHYNPSTSRAIKPE